MKVALVVPFYRQPQMLRVHLNAWQHDAYQGWRIIVVDDGSPEPASDVIGALPESMQVRLQDRLTLYRITKDIPWNRGGARNLGSHVAETDWLVHVDIDHYLPPDCAKALLSYPADPKHWYRFPRWRKGTADETRRKDDRPDKEHRLAPMATFGRIDPHVDSYLIPREMYWSTGGYNERFSGCLGGGGAFLKRLEKQHGPPKLLPEGIHLHVYTRSVVSDASDWSLSRDSAEYARRKRKYGELSKPIAPLNFPWERVWPETSEQERAA